MRLSPRRLSAFALFAALLLIAPAAAEEPRTWKDATGKFSISAKFVSLDAGKVTLEKADGSTVEILLSKLSAADRAYVTQATKPKPAEDDPFQTKPKEGDKPGKDAAETAVDWSQARLVGVNSAPEKWAAAVTPPAIAAELYADPIPLPPKASFFEGVKGVAFSAAAKRAVVGYHGGEPGKPTKQTRLVLLDLVAGKQVAAVKTPGEFAPLALADDGKRVLVRRDEFGFSKQDQVELWGIDEGNIAKLSRFAPYGDQTGPERDVRWAAFLDGDRLATVNVGGKLAVWDAATLKPLYFLPTARDATPALSPDRKRIAFATDKDIGLLDVAAGKVVALRDAPAGMNSALAFSPSGVRLARFSFGKIHVWDAASGELQAELSTVAAGGTGFIWTSEDHVLVGGRTLFDLATQVRLWDYNGGEFAQQFGGLTWFVASAGDKQPGALVPARVPTGAAKAALASAMAEPDFVVLKRGTVVRLDTAGIVEEAEREKTEASLTAKLRANGMEVGPAGTITLVAATEVGKERDLRYRTFGSPRDTVYKFTEHFARVKFVWQGKTAWESAASNSPGFIVHLKQDQTMKEYLKEHERPNYAFLRGVELPKLLTRPTGNAAAPGLGSSQVTAAGVR